MVGGSQGWADLSGPPAGQQPGSILVAYLCPCPWGWPCRLPLASSQEERAGADRTAVDGASPAEAVMGRGAPSLGSCPWEDPGLSHHGSRTLSLPGAPSVWRGVSASPPLSLLPWILQAPERWSKPGMALAPARKCQQPCSFKGRAWVLVTSDLASGTAWPQRLFPPGPWMGVPPGIRPR